MINQDFFLALEDLEEKRAFHKQNLLLRLKTLS